MLKAHAFLALCIAATLTGSVAAASPAKASPTRSAVRDLTGTGHVPQLDGPITSLTAADGRTFAVWSYRASGEFDIAVSTRGANSSMWSAPVFFGRGNRNDELEPALTVDANGNAYIAFATANPSRVVLATLPAGSDLWTEPVTVSGTEAASSPSLLLVGDRLVIGFRTMHGIGLINLPTVGGGNQTQGIQDGPEGVDPINGKGGNNHPADSTTGG
jgi:hypothetical protein